MEGRRKKSHAPKVERRQYLRIEKNFLLMYYDVNRPQDRFNATQMKNISLGGMCLITEKPFEPGTVLGIELKTPFLASLTHLEGTVLESHEKLKNLVYETRIKFHILSPQAEYILNRLIQHYKNEQQKQGS